MEKEMIMEQEQVKNSPESPKKKKKGKRFSKVTAFSLILITTIGCAILLFFLSNKFLGYQENSYALKLITYNKKQVEKKPNDPYWRTQLGYSYLTDKDYSSALEQLDTAIKLNKNYYPAYLNKAIVYREQKKFNKSLEMATKAGKLNGKDFKAFVIKGQCFRELKEYDKAEVDLFNALGLNQSSSDIRYEIGLLYEDMGKKEEAKQFYGEALELDPIFKPAIEGLKRLDK